MGRGDIAMRCLVEIGPFGDRCREMPLSIYNFVKSRLLLGSIYFQMEDWRQALKTFASAVEVGYSAPNNARRSIGAAREISDVFLSTALCLGGMEEASSRIRAKKVQETTFYDCASAIRSTIRFKSGKAIDETTEMALAMFRPATSAAS
jgi:hypothetical protein